jgi:hypothetical protein
VNVLAAASRSIDAIGMVAQPAKKIAISPSKRNHRSFFMAALLGAASFF